MDRRPIGPWTAAVVGITDRPDWDDVRTDNLVVVRPRRRQLVWIPRDVWSPLVGERINVAYKRGGFAMLVRALWHIGQPVGHALIVSRAATERFADRLDVVVPVEEPLRFRYPLAPARAIEEGEKVVTFDPPEARLQGERLHQWVGARYEIGRAGSDMRRLVRQQTLLGVLLRGGAPFASILERDEDVRRLRHPERVLARVDAGWSMRTLEPLEDAERGGSAVLLTASARDRLQARVLRSRR